MNGSKQLVWFITGTSSGFGRELVHAAAKRGDYVIATARSLDRISDFPYGDRVRTLRLDVTSGFGNIKAKVDEAVTYFGRIDVLVNNAGITVKSLLEEGGSDVFRKQFDVNFFGLIDTTSAVLPHMRAQRSGTVVHIGSRSSWASEVPGSGPYVSSKAAVRVLGEALNTELTPFGIRSLIVEPGGFRTNTLALPWYDDNHIDDYNDLRETAKKLIAAVGDRFRGDAAKAMELLVDVVRGEGKAAGKPWTLYLPMGEVTDVAIRGKVKKMLEAVDEWKDTLCDMDIDE
ncbi:NAD-P-binding protein [Trametes coccinea BRFM310]|uniref:NAD-P-binding protein n=1 Tax=Trametes coccinea (strain BRFM310) TaxID=1353009 RepID=A0A1Y2IVM8_TRAC3|nr:NAD-P-binding protein [Trametes coccinea BRFM310]